MSVDNKETGPELPSALLPTSEIAKELLAVGGVSAWFDQFLSLFLYQSNV